MILMRKIAVVAGGLAAAGLAAGVLAPAASAASRPVLYNYAEGWSHGRIEPHQVYVGARGPYLTGLSWSWWDSKSAQGTGTVHIQSSACLQHHPSSACSFYRHAVRVSLWRPRTHAGQLYFSRMKWSFRSAGHRTVGLWKTVRGDFDVSGLACIASMSVPRPSRGATTDALVTTAPGSHVNAKAHYKTTTTPHSRTSGPTGRATIPFDIGGATPGYRVKVSITISSGQLRASCSTSFTPR
jgi:hypothetical protein